MSDRHDVHLRLPASSAFATVLRSTIAGLAARADFTLDDIEDLRMAVGEACAIVLEQADDDASLHCDIDLGRGELTIHVAADVTDGHDPDHGSFAWQVLTALTTGVASHVEDHRVSISLTMHSSAVD
ncbi:anti-sigma regulatory factor [Alteromonas gracilis]